MGAIRKEAVDQFRVAFGELARVRRGEPVQVDPYLIGRAIAAVMRECTVRSAAGRALLWNDYRVILARRDFELVRTLGGLLERDLAQVLAQDVAARRADLIGELRVTVVFDEADELAAGAGVVRVAFVPTERLAQPREGEMTVRFDTGVVSGEIAARATGPGGGGETVFVEDTGAAPAIPPCVLAWPGAQVSLPVGASAVVGRPHPGSPPQFVPLTGASAKVNKQQFWISIGVAGVRIGRLPTANPVHVNGRALAPSEETEVALPVEVSLSRGELVVSVRRG